MTDADSRGVAVPQPARSSLLTRDFALPFEPWWVLWVVAIAGAWLLPTHFAPWPAFHVDLLMTLALLPAAFWIVLRRAESVPVHTSAVAVFCVAFIPALQHAAGIVVFAGDAWISGLYLFGFALALLVGARFEQQRPGQLGNVLFAAIGAGALLSTGLALYQWLRLSGLGLLTVQFPMEGLRPSGNLGQANNLATLLVWGLIALWWGHVNGRCRGWIAAAGAAFIMVGIAATRSRTGWLEVALLGVAALIYRRPLETRRQAKALIALGVYFIVLNLAWGAISDALLVSAGRGTDTLASAGLRPAAWRMFIDAIAQRPWAGWGWNQQANAHYAFALQHPPLHHVFSSAHNLVLDLLVQNGVPLGTLLVLALGAWFITKALRVATPQACLLLLAIGALGLHAMLEYPQQYAYFLLPAGLMMGALDQMLPIDRASRMLRVRHLRRWAGAALLGLATVLVGWVAVEYNLAERNLTRFRFEIAHVGPSRNSRAPGLVMLTQLRGLLTNLRVKPHAGMTPQQLAEMQRAVKRYPSDANELLYALAAGLNGQPRVAEDALARICLMTPEESCALARAKWRWRAAGVPVLSAVKLLKVLEQKPTQELEQPPSVKAHTP
ncbi:MAG: O-antigen ligase C-terminal domain-containing protein [Proteobacteria bacterium]|nr:O-antigen ligase C-terminal domain-containing protein [Pseudomonadota bacterium]